MIFINNKRVTCDHYGNLIEQVFYDDVHLNNKISTNKLVTNIKHHLGLRGRNLESLPMNRLGFPRVPLGPQREPPYNERRRRNYHNNQPLLTSSQPNCRVFKRERGVNEISNPFPFSFSIPFHMSFVNRVLEFERF